MCKIILFYFLTAYLLISFTDAATSESGSHNGIWGARSPRDVHLSRQMLMKKAKPLRIVSEDYEFRQALHPRTITQIVISDQYTNDNGGFAALKSGGPSMDFAIIHLKSQRGHGYNFTIDIFGQ